ncbi:hypothetical protein BGZ65_011153 [Modicella reniformis]|uniref:Uncharacterized protein n=1 Tax=Modicella reniformis TaxID=1440133 RepID=A0A9P6IRV9_9FUNG|nr:hypothetical protein BGZ65_011153 [Modicella reniformis]
MDEASMMSDNISEALNRLAFGLSDDEPFGNFGQLGRSFIQVDKIRQMNTDIQRLYECVQQLLKVYREERMAVQAPHESWMVNRLWSSIAERSSERRRLRTCLEIPVLIRS